MAYDEHLAGRLRALLKRRRGVTERKMFGGLAFLVNGHMAVGVNDDELMVRLGPDAWAEALRRPHAREMDFTGRSLKGFVYVGRKGVASDADLKAWAELGVKFARSLPPKPDKT